MNILPNSVLIVVDMQNDFLDPKGSLYLGKRVPSLLNAAITSAVEVIETFKAANAPIYVLKDTHHHDSTEFINIPAHCIRDSWGHDLYPDIENALSGSNVTVMNKFEFDGSNRFFLFTNEKPIITDIYLIGVASDICVYHTAVGLTSRYLGQCIHIIKNATFPYSFLWEMVTEEMLDNLFGIKSI